MFTIQDYNKFLFILNKIKYVKYNNRFGIILKTVLNSDIIPEIDGAIKFLYNGNIIYFYLRNFNLTYLDDICEDSTIDITTLGRYIFYDSDFYKCIV